MKITNSGKRHHVHNFARRRRKAMQILLWVKRRRWRSLQILFWVTLGFLVAYQLDADLEPVHLLDSAFRQVLDASRYDYDYAYDYPLASTQVTRATHPHLWTPSTVTNSSSNSSSSSNSNVNSTRPAHENNSKPSYNLRLPTILAQLNGEMANNLSFLAHARGLQYMLLKHYGLETNLLLRHQTDDQGKDISKWLQASKNIQKCFPALRKWDFSQGAHWAEWEQRVSQQQRWLDIQKLATLDLVNGKRSSIFVTQRPKPLERKQLEEALQLFQQLLQSESPERPTVVESSNANTAVSLPYLYSESMDDWMLIDEYYDDFRELLQFDRRCCKQAPDPDESVFHFRNFQNELKGGLSQSMGFEETTPNQTANLLFGHLKPGDKVAITTRFQDNAYTRAQVRALEARGLKVRVIAGQNAGQDFCFLTMAKKEFVGNVRSTYAMWAAILGNMQVARLYTVDSRGLRQRYGGNFRNHLSYNWTNPKLDYVRFETYKSEAKEL